MLSVIFYILFILFTLVYIAVFSVVWLVTLPFDRNRTVLHIMSRWWTKAYFDLIPAWKVRVEGLENVERGRPYVIIVNHRSMLDILLMYVLPLEFKWVAKKEVYRWPLFGWVMMMHGDIGIERGTPSAVRKMIAQGGAWLDRGVSIIIFPEGSRGKEDRVGKFKEGAFALAKSAGVPILPCVSRGTGTAFIGWKVNFRNRFSLRVLPPVPAEEVERTATKDLAAKMQAVMAKEYEKMKKGEI